jgi:predicted ferric reductase
MNTLHLTTPAEMRERPDAAQRPKPPARRAPEEPESTAAIMLPPLVGAIVGIVVLLAAGVVFVGQAGGLAALGAALIGAQGAWYLSRASAFVAYLLLWWSMILGLSMTNRLARVWPGGPTAGELHEQASLLGLAFAMLHALVLIGDQYIGYTLPQILIPFATSYAPFWVGLGQIGLYVMALVTLSFYVRRWIGARTWRSLHYLSFAVFVLALVHGVASGTDSGALWAIAMYAGSALSVAGMTIYRIVARRQSAATPAARIAS